MIYKFLYQSLISCISLKIQNFRMTAYKKIDIIIIIVFLYNKNSLKIDTGYPHI